MNTKKQIGVIECGNSTKLFQLTPINLLQGYTVSKVFYKNQLPQSVMNRTHPGAMIVSDQSAIIDDAQIEMVIVSSPSHEEMHIVGDTIRANKAIRVV